MIFRRRGLPRRARCRHRQASMPDWWRSAVTIGSYLAAMPLAAAATSLSRAGARERTRCRFAPLAPWAAIRCCSSQSFWSPASGSERCYEWRQRAVRNAHRHRGSPGGSTLGAIRAGLVALVLVLIFDRLIRPVSSRNSCAAHSSGRSCRGRAEKPENPCRRRPRPSSIS